MAKLQSWKTKQARVKAIRKLVEKAGGPMHVTWTYLVEQKAGLMDHYLDMCTQKKDDGTIPHLYYVLTEAGYSVTPSECTRGISGRRTTASMHGHWNHSRPEALIDDWVNDIVGKSHIHDAPYPGQDNKKPGRKLDCDFVLVKPRSSSQDLEQGLWIEYAGIARKKGGSSLVKQYSSKIKQKVELAEKAGLDLVIITRYAMENNPQSIWQEIIAKAPWLKPYQKKAMASRFFKQFSNWSFLTSYIPQRSKHTRESLIKHLQKRIQANKPLNIGSCKRDKAFGKYYQRMAALSVKQYGRPLPKTWWTEWLVQAGVNPREAAHKARLAK